MNKSQTGTQTPLFEQAEGVKKSPPTKSVEVKVRQTPSRGGLH
jgi:hypothetical protein